MAINILGITPHQVSRDLRGYSVFFYGEPKSGKTTTAAKFPNSLLLAFEKGYSAIPGVMAQPINSWSEFRQVLRQLKTEEAKAVYATIIIDTADIAYDYVSKYICDNAKRPDGGFGVDNISDIPFGKGYGLVSQEFDECLRSIVQMGYGLVLISHATDKTFTSETGQEYNKIVPTLDKRATNIVSRMADIIGYSRAVTAEDGTESVKLFMRGTQRYMAGSRFKYTPDYIDFSYDNLVNAIADAIDQQAAAEGKQYFTNEAVNLHQDTIKELDFDELMGEFSNILNDLTSKVDEKEFQDFWQPRLTETIEKYLGKGNKISNCNRTQVEAVSLIVADLHELVKKYSK